MDMLVINNNSMYIHVRVHESTCIAKCLTVCVCVCVCSATGTAELLNHEQEEVDRILVNVSRAL